MKCSHKPCTSAFIFLILKLYFKSHTLTSLKEQFTKISQNILINFCYDFSVVGPYGKDLMTSAAMTSELSQGEATSIFSEVPVRVDVMNGVFDNRWPCDSCF